MNTYEKVETLKETVEMFYDLLLKSTTAEHVDDYYDYLEHRDQMRDFVRSIETFVKELI